jgi:hypothetical protein
MAGNTPQLGSTMGGSSGQLPKVNVGPSTGNDVQDQYQTGWLNALGGGKKERASAVAMANVNRDWQKMMSDTAHQRGMQDMIKAGLNPALMYASGGSAQASTPSGGQAFHGQSNVGSLLGLIGSAIFAGAKIATSAVKATSVAKAGATAGTGATIVKKIKPEDMVIVDKMGKKTNGLGEPVGYDALKIWNKQKVEIQKQTQAMKPKNSAVHLKSAEYLNKKIKRIGSID